MSGYIGFTCLTCGHEDMVHVNWTGKCLYGTDGFTPCGFKTPVTCDCEAMK